MFVNLETALQIGEGNRRLVFVHPDDPDLLIKVVKPTARLKYPRFEGIRRRYMHTTPILRELREQIVVRMQGPLPPRFLPRVTGFVDTDFGIGVVVRAERGPDGDYARTLRSMIRKGDVTPKHLEDIRKLVDDIRRSEVVIGDLTSANIVYAATAEEGERFVLIDGVGDKTLFPFHRIAFFRRRGKERAIKRIAGDLGLASL